MRTWVSWKKTMWTQIGALEEKKMCKSPKFRLLGFDLSAELEIAWNSDLRKQIKSSVKAESFFFLLRLSIWWTYVKLNALYRQSVCRKNAIARIITYLFFMTVRRQTVQIIIVSNIQCQGVRKYMCCFSFSTR